MSRARIGALALVNWRGVFYERYLLDRHVTALEGANGAGKTTVMVAAYVALLPDLTRLRFTNVGESGATGGDRGIWGRLGEPARPAYTVLDLELAGGTRLIAGVRLRRLSEPSVEATTWVIRGLPPDVALSDVLLQRHEDLDHVAELDEIKQAARRHGGTLEQFRSTKEYFAALFEAGVTPLRLATDEDRNKLNEMLRTSMTGGISRVLTSELRSFLLKAEVGLGDVLGRMRENLEACRRTRAEVAEARVLERDISAVYEAGQAMLSAAYCAAQRAAAEIERAAADARAALAAAEREASELAATADALSAREAVLEQENAAVRAAERAQAARLERLRSARQLAQRVRELARQTAERHDAAQLTAAALASAAAERESARITRDRLQEAQQRAALGLAQLQDGLDELHRRAYAYREFGRALRELRELTSRPDLDPSAVPALREQLSQQRESLQAQRARRQRDRDAAAARGQERQRAHAAMEQLEAALARAELTPPPAPQRPLHTPAHHAPLPEPQRDAATAPRAARSTTNAAESANDRIADPVALELSDPPPHEPPLLGPSDDPNPAFSAVALATGHTAATEHDAGNAPRTSRSTTNAAESANDRMADPLALETSDPPPHEPLLLAPIDDLNSAFSAVGQATGHTAATAHDAGNAARTSRSTTNAADSADERIADPLALEPSDPRPQEPPLHSTPETRDPLSRARAVLGFLDELGAEVARLSQLRLEHAELARGAARQRECWDRAAQLGLACGAGRDARNALRELSASCSAALAEAEGEASAAQAELESASAALGQVRAREVALAAQAERWPSLAAAAALVERTLGVTLGDREQLAAARTQTVEESAELLARRRQLQAERDEALRIAGDLTGAGAALDPELLRLRDELGADLLIERFEDAPVEQAAALEAALGPLTSALVVDDPHAAAQALAGKPRTANDVWLVRAGADLELEPETATVEGDAIRVERFGARVTRLPAQPAIGSKARAARAAAMRERAESIVQALEACGTRARQLTAAQRALDVLQEAQAHWLAGDPATEIARLTAELEPLTAAEATAMQRLSTARHRCAAARERHEACVRLEADAHLLDGSDHALAAARMQERIERIRRGQELLEAVAENRQALRNLLEALRPAATDEDPASAARELEQLDAELERHYRAIAAADSVLAQRHASGWADADERLGAQSEILPALRAQHDEARAAVARADRAVIEADAAWERAAAAAHRAGAEHAAAVAAESQATEELRALGGAPEDSLIALAETEFATAEQKSAELGKSSRKLIAELARTRERAERAVQTCELARREVERATTALTPARLAWQAMQASTQQAGLDLRTTVEPDRSAATLAADADAQRALLIERLLRSRGGAEAAREIEAAPDVLASWAVARSWLLRRVPAQIAGHDDPLRALERLRDDLNLLQERLSRQEQDLRGASEDIARGIDVQLRRAATQVRRLNERIAGVEFGSISAIRVQLRRVDRMEQILKALREGEAQELLFLPSIPVEEALEEIFRRYGGGRGGGQRLLDYREYLELAVEIRRKTSDQWELASPTKLSTGEAIGVGAALMMVVLAEWERDANLLRARATSGSLRFLFLDEANRLSQDNLGVLFELCRTLDLQLLIAAPEVARADGNTTYRLVRHLTDDGREEVIVSGRRAVAQTSSAGAAPD